MSQVVGNSRDSTPEFHKTALFLQITRLIELLKKKYLGGMDDMPAEVTAMFIGAKDAKKFYISSALSSGRVPELTGMLMMALEENAPIDEIKSVLVQVYNMS